MDINFHDLQFTNQCTSRLQTNRKATVLGSEYVNMDTFYRLANGNVLPCLFLNGIYIFTGKRDFVTSGRWPTNAYESAGKQIARNVLMTNRLCIDQVQKVISAV